MSLALVVVLLLFATLVIKGALHLPAKSMPVRFVCPSIVFGIGGRQTDKFGSEFKGPTADRRFD